MKNFSVEEAAVPDHFAYDFRTLVKIPERGVYRFYTFSDDGSKLYIDGKLIVDNDGGHSGRRAEGKVALEAGYHELHLLYFEDTWARNWKSGIRDGMFWKPCYLIPCCLYRIKSALVTLCLVLFPIFIGGNFFKALNWRDKFFRLFIPTCSATSAIGASLANSNWAKRSILRLKIYLWMDCWVTCLKRISNKRRDNGTCFTISDTVISAAIF